MRATSTAPRRRAAAGGIGALVASATFVFGFALYVTVLADYTTSDRAPADSVAFAIDHRTALYVWHLVILIAFGVALVPTVLAVGDRLRPKTPVLAQAATAFGVIWAGLVIAAGMIANLGLGVVERLHRTDPSTAEPVWAALDTVQNGLGGGNELVGGTWVLLVCIAAWRSRAFARGLCVLGLISGAAGIATVAPALEEVGAVFGLGLIVWFAWVGTALLRIDPPDETDAPMVAPTSVVSAR